MVREAEQRTKDMGRGQGLMRKKDRGRWNIKPSRRFSSDIPAPKMFFCPFVKDIVSSPFSIISIINDARNSKPIILCAPSWNIRMVPLDEGTL